MKIKEITNYKGRFCAEMENGEFILNNGSTFLMRCEKVPEGMKVIESDIIAGMIMRTEEDFKRCVECL